MNFVEMIMYYGRSNPEKQAIMLSDRLITYGMLAAGIRSVEIAIQDASLDQRHMVAVCIKNQLRHLIVVCALYRLGIVSVSLIGNPETLRTDAVIADEPASLPNLGRMISVDDDWFAHPVKPDAPPPKGFANEDSLARIVMSSGTSATPKAIGMSARVIEDRIVTGRRTLASAPWDRMMCLPHITSSLGFGSTLQALAYGHGLVFAETALEALQTIALYNVDLLVANPDYLKGMIKVHRETPIPTPSLKLIKYGGAALAPSVVSDVRSRLCNNILCVYSSTESGPIAYAHIDRILEQPNATGFIAPWVEVEVVGPDDVPLPSGVEGRLRVRSQWQGYALKEGVEASRKWMYPGDIGRISDNGMLSLVGRFADAISVNGRFVAPEQMEQELIAYPGIEDVAVASMPLAGGRREFWAVVVCKAPLDAAAIKAFVTEKNPAWALARVAFVDRIPRNDMGKIVRGRVRDLLLE